MSPAVRDEGHGSEGNRERQRRGAGPRCVEGNEGGRRDVAAVWCADLEDGGCDI